MLKKLKTEFKLKKKYVEVITNDTLSTERAAFHLYGHNLDTEPGRHINVSRHNRICRLCSMRMVESEYHFLFVCLLYNNLRKNLMANTVWPLIKKFK